MIEIRSTQDYKEWLKKNREKLHKNAIKIEDLPPDDDWVNDDGWDDAIPKEVSKMSGIGESLVNDARLDDLQRLVIAGKIGSIDEAKYFYPSLEEEDIREIFNSLHNNTSNQN